MTDQTLNGWQSGNTAAFEALFQQYKRVVLKNAYLMTASRTEAEDILQEVFVSVWKSRRSFNPDKGKFTTWLHKITTNKCLEKQRKKRPGSLPLEALSCIETGGGQEEELMKKQEYEKLMQIVNSLDRNHRAVLVLRYFNELSYEEIARTMSIPLGTVKSRIYVALKILRERLNIYPEEASA